MTLVVNTDFDGDKKFIVVLWTGVSYILQEFEVYAFNEEHALACVLAFCEKKGIRGLYITEDQFSEDLTDEERDELYYYIDPTMADRKAFPAYVRLENFGIEKVS
jgi:hypothetical protein